MSRSSNQNRLYWKLCRRVAQYLIEHNLVDGKDEEKVTDDVHLIFKINFNYEPMGDFRFPRTTTKLSTAEFHDYFEECQQFALEKWQVSAFEDDDKPFGS